MKPEEQKVLGILATIFGAIALLGSWIPFINYPSLFIAIVALILGIIGLIVNLKNEKQWPLSEQLYQLLLLSFSLQPRYCTLMSTMILSGEFNRSYREASASMEREEESDLTDDSSDFIPEEEEEDSFTWTQKSLTT